VPEAAKEHSTRNVLISISVLEGCMNEGKIKPRPVFRKNQTPAQIKAVRLAINSTKFGPQTV
jgi:hypothetical protein